MRKTSKGRIIRYVLGVLLLLGVLMYVAICVLVAVFQRRLIYHPPRFSAAAADAGAKRVRLERWRAASGEAIGFKRPAPQQPATGQVLVLYGNGGSAIGCTHYADDIQSVATLDVFFLDYPGYADRAGRPTEQNFYRAADQALQSLSTNRPTYLLGESLGTGIATYLAGTQPERIAGVVLLSPFDRGTAMAHYGMPLLPTSLMLVDRFPSADYLAQYRGPVAMTLDGRDTIIPPRFTRKLYDGYTGPKRLWEFPDSGHIGIGEPRSQFWREVFAFWQTNHPTAKQ